jgi:multidrug efflux pump subunit AcrB
MKQLLAAFARNTVFANIVLVLIFLAGAMAALWTIRENFPEFSLDMITITVAYPGADPEELEEGVSRKIEEAIEGIEGIKQFTTKSNENSATAIIEVKEDYDVEPVLDRVRTKVNAITTFPVDAEKPIITELLLKDPVMLLYLTADMSERRIKEWSERFKDELMMLPQVSQVAIFGGRQYEIGIEVSQKRLEEYGLTADQVATAIRNSNLNLAGGTIRTSGEEIRVRTMGRKYTGKELADIVVMAGAKGEIITLGRLADIKDGFTEDPIQSSINGEPAVMLIVYKTKAEDSLAISHAVSRWIKKRQAQLPPGVGLKTLYDNTQMLRARINLLTRNGLIGMSIVFVILYIFLNARLSFWAGLGIPVSIAGALAVLWSVGGTINMISLFGLIMVLGIVVDDAIVVGEAIYVHRQAGKPPLLASVDGVREVGMPVIAAVITTILAFIPLSFVGGIMGKFIFILPIVVIACLAVSLVECLFLLPAHLSHLPDLNQPKASGFHPLSAMHHFISRGLELFILRIYKPFLKKTLEWRYVSFCVAIAILFLTLGFVQGGILKFEVMPEIDGFIMTSHVEFPAGTPPAVTTAAIKQMQAALLRLADKTDTKTGAPMIEDRITLVGQNLKDIPEMGPHVGSVQAILLSSEDRGVAAKDLMVAWEKEIGPIPGLKSLTFSGMGHGPPGDPIEVWIQGHDMDQILSAAEELKGRLRKFEGVFQIRSDFAPGKNEIRFVLKPQARTLGVTVNDLARQINAAYFGREAIRLQRNRDDVRVKVRYTSAERRNYSDLARMRIRTPAGHLVPLMTVADVTFAPGYATITRTNGMRRVSVSAGVDTTKANAGEILTELAKNYLPGLKDRFTDIHVAVQGEQKKMRESFDSLKVAFPIAILGIFIVIATMFRSYLQPFVIMFTVPFGIIGAIIGHMLMGFDLTMMSVFGMVALTGVVVNDAIVLIERVNVNLAQGQSFFEALVNGGMRRFRAIFLTTISTVGGLAPLIFETNLQAKFMIPMALSLAAGVIFATLLTLILIPSLLTILNDLRLLYHRLRHGVWPARSAVEPSRDRFKDLMKPAEEVEENESEDSDMPPKQIVMSAVGDGE